MEIGALLTAGLLVSFVTVADSYTGQIPIGAIFDRDDVESQKALDYAFSKHKEKAATQEPHFQFNVTTEAIDIHDNFQLTRAICKQMSQGVFAILGQKSIQSADIVRSLTSTFHMPYITPSLSATAASGSSNRFELHMRPDHTAAMVDVIEELQWDTVLFLYDSDEGLQRFQNIFRRMRNDSVLEWFSMLRFNSIQDVHDDLILADKNGKNRMGFKSFVLDLSSEEAYATVLQQIPEVGMNKFGYAYLLGTLDFKSFNLSRFQHGGVNITGFQLFEEGTTRELTKSIKEAKQMDGLPDDGDGLPVHAALTVDGLNVIDAAISGILRHDRSKFHGIFRRGELYNLNLTKGIPCTTNPPRAWMFGKDILKEMKEGTPEGLSGSLSFNEAGSRQDYKLGVYSMGLDTGVKKIGSWSPKKRFVGVHDIDTEEYPGMGSHRDDNETKIVISILSAPFLMKAKRKDGDPMPVGNKQFEGYSIDLAEKLAEIIDFKYEFRIVNDSSYGTYENGSWNGIIRELLDGKGDLAIAPLTITAERERFVDFSKPFMEVGVNIMIKKPQSQKPGIFSFMEPLSIEVWFCIIVAYLTVSVALFLVSRFSPLEWRRDQDHVEGEADSYHNDFSLFNSFWFSMGALMFQGSDSCPRSASGRIIGGAWWFFVLIIISSYTANLAAFLTIERMVTPIESADDLVNHPHIKYGALSSGTTLQFFKNSEVPVYRQMGVYMSSNPDAQVQTNEEGFQRVLSSKGKYAFLAESVTVEYANNQKPCETTSVGGKLNHKGFGIATPRNSKLRDHINVAVLKLKEDGTLYQLFQNWWVEKGQCGGGAAGGKKNKLSLTLSNVAGIFYILIVGLVFAIILGVFEFMCFRAKHKTEDTVTGDCYLKGTNTQSTLCLPPEREEFPDTLQSPPEQRGFIGFEKFAVEYAEHRNKTT